MSRETVLALLDEALILLGRDLVYTCWDHAGLARVADVLATARAQVEALVAERNGLSFQAFRAVNLARCTAADGFGHALDSWSLAEWTNAIAGEVGEACNYAKKLLRHRDGVRGNVKDADKDVALLKRNAARELADVIIYADLTLAALGYETGPLVAEVFNAKSLELNSPYLVGAGIAAAERASGEGQP